MSESKENIKKEEEKGQRGFMTRLGRLVLLIVFIPVILSLLLQIPFIQKGALNILTSRIELKIDRDISIEKAYLNIFKGLELENFSISGNAPGDTLIKFKKLNISLTDNLFSLIKGDLNLNTIEIEGSKISITKAKGETKNDLTLLLEKFSSSDQDTTKASKPIRLDLKTVGIKDVVYEIKDLNSGSLTSYALSEALIKIDTLDLENNNFFLSSFYAKNPKVHIVKGIDSTKVKISEKIISDEIEKLNTNKEGGVHLAILNIEIENGEFSFLDLVKDHSNVPEAIDLKDFTLLKIEMDIDSFEFNTGFNTDFDLKNISFEDDKGFVLENLSAVNVKISNDEVSFPNLVIKTEKTNIASNLSFAIEDIKDFSDFVNKVYIRGDLNRSTIAINDVVHFVPALYNSPFFAQNREKVFKFDGEIRGTIQNLSGRKITLTDNTNLSFKGNFGAVNLTDRENALINLKVDKLSTSLPYLRKLIPGFNPPENFNKIGSFEFQGRFDGYFQDFVAFGLLKSGVGTADLDMRLDVKLGNEKAKYSGTLRLIEFDLGKWADRDDLGKVNFIAEVKDGQGLTLSSAYADLLANIESLVYKGYVYNNVKLNGTLEENKFNGDFSIVEENIDLDFKGDISYIDSIFVLDLKADIRKIDLYATNLSNKIKTVSGSFSPNLSGTGLNDLVGAVNGSNIKIVADTIYSLDTFSLYSYYNPAGSNRLEFESEMAKGNIEGVYRLGQLIPQLKQIIRENYPYHTRSWVIDSKEYATNDFEIDLEVFDTKNFFDLIGAKNLNIKNLQSKITIDSDREVFNLIINSDLIKYKNNAFYNSDIVIDNRNKEGFLVVNVDSTVVNGKTYNPLYLESKLNADSLSFEFTADKIVDSIDIVSIKATLIPHPKGYKINVRDSTDLSMFGSNWKIYKYNETVIGNKFVDIRDLVISDGYREIEIEDIDNKGISVLLKRFNFRTINGLIDYDKIDFTGEGDVTLRVENLINDKTYIQANVYVDDLRLNEESYGKLNVFFDKDYDDSYKVLLSIDKGEQNVKANFTYDSESDMVNGYVRGKKFPLDIFEFIIGDGISETKGTGDLNATISGHPNDLKISGKAIMSECGVKIDYLGTSFFMDNQVVNISERMIDLTDAVLTDAEGNPGIIKGGLRHTLFKDFRLDLSMSAQNAVVINTEKKDNPLYYGKGIGKVNVNFTGSFEAANIDVRAETREGTKLNIPVKNTETDYEESFITFVNKEELLAPKKIDPNAEFKIEGLNITMDLTMTEEADVDIIFNERLGDIIKGNGRGNLQIIIKRTGEFQIFGDYEVEEGDYLFTARNLVAKSFKVRRGGRIKWTGDPINATLDLRADYLVRSPLNVFLNEFLFDQASEASREASNAQNIKLILELEGTLYAPEVNFDLEFPDLVGELNSYAQSKLRTLRTNEIALNSQVFGLLVSGQFLPENNPLSANLFGSDELVQTGISTIGEFISSQLSRIFTGLLQEALSENGLIAGVDFEIGLRNNTGYFASAGNATSDLYPDEITLNLRNRFRFLDERLSLGGGFNYVRESPLQGINDYYIPNVVVEYFLTDDRQLKLRFYYRRDIDELSLNARRDRLGLGIGFRKEFGSITEAIRGVTNSVKDQNDDNN
jgi:hypothetical protein